MAKRINNLLEGLSLRDLISSEGIILEVDDDLKSSEDIEEFSFTPDVHLTNDEVLNLLNMEDFLDDDNVDDDSKNVAMTVSMANFESLKRRMLDLTGDDKVMKLIKQEGVGDVVPADAQVTVNYIGYFEGIDEPFDSTFTRGRPDILRLGQDSLIMGLEIAIASMKKHEVSIFIIHPDMGYGPFGCLPRIPGNAEVLFVVHLLNYVDNGCIAAIESLPIEERNQFQNIVKRVNAKFNSGNDCFQRGRYKQAIREYSKGLEWMEEATLANAEEEKQANALLSRGYNNLAVCYNKENMPRRACSSCNRVVTPTAKTYLHHGRALGRIGEYNEAMKKLHLALKMEPRNDVVIKEIKLVNEKQKKYADLEKQLWKNSLKMREDKDLSDFDKNMYEICKNFSEDEHLLRQPLPDGLTLKEIECIRGHAASFRLSVTQHYRYDKEIMYICKPNY